MLTFENKYSRLAEEERISLTTKIVSELQALNLAQYPAIATYLSSAEYRLNLLKMIVNGKINNDTFDIKQVIDNIENLA